MPNVKFQRYVECPQCENHQWCVEHLFEKDMNDRPCWWNCKSCSARFKFLVVDGHFSIKPCKAELVYNLTLLQYKFDPEMYVIVKGISWLKNTPEENADHSRYHYEEHTCPTNFLGVSKIVRDGNFDWHGLFNFVRHVDIPDAEKLTGMALDSDDFHNFGYELVFPELVHPDNRDTEPSPQQPLNWD